MVKDFGDCKVGQAFYGLLLKTNFGQREFEIIIN